MKFVKIISIWVILALAISAKIIYSQPKIDKTFVIVILLLAGLLIGVLQYFVFSTFSSNRKEKIFKSIVQDYNGKLNAKGSPEISMGGRKVIVEYDTEMTKSELHEYVIAYVDISDLDERQVTLCDRKFELEIIDNQPYVSFFSHWKFEGYSFANRMEEKIKELNGFIEKITPDVVF